MSKIRLITGGIGTGKSLWTVEQLFKEHEKTPEREIYTDITGIKHTGIKKAPDDWREIPNNSLIVYDEVQYRDLFSRHNSKRDKQILDLTTIRKRGIELWLITQRARFLNADVLGLVNEHVHLERVGQKISNVYIWQEAELNITKTKKMFAFDKYRWAYPEHIFGFYESIQPDAKHNKRSYLNKAVVSIVITLVLALIAGAIFVKFASSKGISATGVETKKPEQQTMAQPIQNPNATSASSPVANNSDKELQSKIDLCVKQFGWTSDQCKQAYDPKTEQVRNQQLEQSTGNHMDQVVFKYNASKPFENTYEVNAQPVDFPKFAGCMKKNGRYVAYTQQGTILKDVSASDCKRVIENGDRPFDYFKQPNQMAQQVEQRERSVPEQTQLNPETSSL